MSSADSGGGDVFDRAARKADEVEAEMKRIGYWQADPPAAAALRFAQPFAADTMSFPQWLQFVFLPKVRAMTAARKAAPDGSAVGTYAVRALDGDPNADGLASLLSEFDSLFGTPKVYLTAGRSGPRFTPLIKGAVWTVLMVAAGVLSVGYGSRLAPRVRMERYAYTAHAPASGGYESISLTAAAEGPAGRVAPTDLHLRLYPKRDPVPNGDLTVDLRTNTYRYADPDGSPRTGPFAPDAALAWFKRCGIAAADAPLAAEAAALVGFAGRVAKDPAATFDATRAADAAPAAPGEAFRLSAKSNVARDRPGTVPLWLRVAVPAAVWLVGLAALSGMTRRRAGGGVTPV